MVPADISTLERNIIFLLTSDQNLLPVDFALGHELVAQPNLQVSDGSADGAMGALCSRGGTVAVTALASGTGSFGIICAEASVLGAGVVTTSPGTVASEAAGVPATTDMVP